MPPTRTKASTKAMGHCGRTTVATTATAMAASHQVAPAPETVRRRRTWLIVTVTSGVSSVSSGRIHLHERGVRHSSGATVEQMGQQGARSARILAGPTQRETSDTHPMDARTHGSSTWRYGSPRRAVDLKDARRRGDPWVIRDQSRRRQRALHKPLKRLFWNADVPQARWHAHIAR